MCGGVKMFRGNKIYYITAAAVAFWFIASNYGLTLAGY